MSNGVEMTLEPQKKNLLSIPKAAPVVRNAFYDALQLDQSGRKVEANRIFNELLNQDLENYVVMAALGMNYVAQEKHGVGLQLLRMALDHIEEIFPCFERLGLAPKHPDDPNLPVNTALVITQKKAEVLNAMGTCYKHENRTEEARKYFLEAQSLIPLNADIQNNLGTLYINEGKPEEAAKYLELAAKINPEHPQALWNLSLARLEQGDYKRGWETYDKGFDAAVRTERMFSQKPLPRWDGSKGKRIIVYGEQGIGDEIMFASCLPEAIRDSKQVVLECHKRLQKLFHDSFPGIDIYPTREDDVITWPPNYPEGFDARIAIGSLPRFYRPTLEHFPGKPYINPPAAKEAQWGERLNELFPRKPVVGISWIGGAKRTRVEVRSIQLEQMLPILQAGHEAGIEFVSLQYTKQEDEIAAFEAKHGIKIHQFPETIYAENYAETAALVANLDLIITVCTSVVHLAGAMGVPTWVLTPSRPAWRYRLDLPFMPWYGETVTLFRQDSNTTKWEGVIAEVAEALADLGSSLSSEGNARVSS